MPAHILIVDDDGSHRAVLRTIIEDWGYDVSEASDGETAVAMTQERPYDSVLMDIRMGGMDGITAQSQIAKHNPSIPVLIMTAYSSINTAVVALKQGAYDYLIKPLDFDVLKITIERMLDHTRLVEENRSLKEKSSGKQQFGMIGSSERMHELVETITTVAPTHAPVLITGESGTGKELVAKAVYTASERSSKPFVTINCAALSESLLESELFGHEKGAFTGADKRRDGLFWQANGGTIFMDEVGEIPLSLQAKLLRVLQQGELQRVGSDSILHVDIRVIAATNRDLQEEVANKTFREDLYYRLNVIGLEVPSLRERQADIPLLAEHFMKIFAEKYDKSVIGFSPQAMDVLVNNPWQGNIRELENTIERAVIMATTDYITDRELPASLRKNVPDHSGNTTRGAELPLGDISLESLEKRAVQAALKKHKKKVDAAGALGITRATLHSKIKKYGLEEQKKK
ncbi:sigma-54 dependent transcriptional regulator [Halodesulfovibrio sp.]|jgi:two-component system response regulator HydG|uniref:sigma-54-dependent transcriptional regulator n=1 Tax=Halodesulfovibrio sp. TaxID=1912772 RepID=UPI0025EAC68A|nr:sigma-54 dependent transcriptional regulator [Halodesulfovibrio sp.]MCT4625401.1 sigma-54 dependent transcriptional regulator [Halodesulfovibrio sp.]